MNWVHLVSPRSSAHPDPFHLTIKPTLGAGGNDPDIAGFGGGGPPPATTSAAGTVVVWLPDSKTETKTREPLGARVRARGCFPRMAVTFGLGAGVVGSEDLTWCRARTT